VEAAGADLAATSADQQNVLLSAMAEVARNYVDLRGYQRRYQIAEENLRSQRETLEVTDKPARALALVYCRQRTQRATMSRWSSACP
jgi:outer membrane protein TolC